MKQISEPVKTQLLYFFRRNGYFRTPDSVQQKLKKHNYKKGYEIRFVAGNKKELSEIRSLLKKAGFKPGKPYSKCLQFVQPVYGKSFYEKFRSII
jgi:hypothetical protein